MSKRLILHQGSRIAVIGGGPAGAFFAHFAKKHAEELGMDIRVTIFDGKDFLQRGPKGCNLCAGVIAESLNQKLKDEGISLPEKRIINRLEGYSLHAGNRTISLSCADHNNEKINTVFRGNGPRFSSFPDVISFDDFLLTWAKDMGGEIVPQPVWDILIPDRRDEPLIILFGKKNAPERYSADLVVCAFGVNSSLMKKVQRLRFGFMPPKTLLTYQAEFNLGAEYISHHFGNVIHVYMLKSKILRYATIIPKRDYITVTLIGKDDASPRNLEEFLTYKQIKKRIPTSKPHCSCYARIAVSPAKNPFTDRLVLIGDASYSRHYKNGIESAFLTAKLASETAFFYGIDRFSFFTHYYRQAKKQIINDNLYGRLLFLINDMISAAPLFTQAHFTVADKRSTPTSIKLRSILWNMFTGNIPYKNIFKISMDLRLQLSLLWTTICLPFKRLINRPKDSRKGIDARHT
jgi:flavin-dependent dehydrogenase